MSVIQLIQKKYLRDERVLQLLLLLSLLRGSPHFFFDNDVDFFHGRSNFERDLSFGNVLGHTTHFSSSFGDVLHPKSLDRILSNYQQSVLQDLNILGNYDHPHGARHFLGTLTSHLDIQAYLLNAESSVESTVEGGYIVSSPMPESLNESDTRNAVLTASLPRASNDIFEDLDLLETIWKQDVNFPFTQEDYNENENDDEIAELAIASKLDLGHVFSFTKDKDHGDEPNGESLVFEIPETKDLDLLMNFTSVSEGDEFLCVNKTFDEVEEESNVKATEKTNSSQSILEEDQLLEFNLDEALKLVGLNSSPESESKDCKDIDTDSGCGDSAVSDLGTDFVPPDSLDELNDSLDEMIQASQMHHQHSRNFQGRLGGLVRSGSMEQRWQDLASLLSIPSPDQAHHAQSPPAVAMASHSASPIHTHSHSHQPAPVHHPHALYPPHEGVSLCSPSTSVPRSILVHNANNPPQPPPPPPPPPPIPDSHNITYANSIGASSHLVASSMNLANNSDISNNDHQHYKMETSSTIPQDIMYYQNSGTEMNQSTDGFLSSILNDEDLQLMDIPLNEYNGRNGSDYGVNTFRYSSSEDPHRIPIVAQKKHHMFGKRYFHENSHAGTTPSNNLGASGNTLGGGIPLVTPYAPPYATAQGATPMEGATAIDPSEMKYSCTMDFRPEDATSAVDHVQHNHTYHMSPDGPSGIIRPNSRDKKGRKNDSEKNMSRDEKRARAMNLPISCDDIINLPMDEFNERISKYDLSEAQLSLIRDIRRRGKNKVAAQNCRKRKLDQIVHLAEEVKVIQYRKNELHSQLDHLSSERARIKHKFSLLYRHIFQSLRDQDGNPYSPHEYSLQQSSDGSIHLVLRSSPSHSGDYVSNKGRSSNDE
ncbi:UNVERIFIED_CONTAM: hypothetical protein RMT77_009479 [Armadillidium vulgare]